MEDLSVRDQFGGGAGLLDETFIQAGFVNVRSQVINAPVVMPSAKDYVRFEYKFFAALHQMLGGLSEVE